ncbi:MAG: hypothetical protein RAK22_01700, partial [Nanoarchaeota archaeon]|nr:hypothetical protein [Nanoarchaeota archaeon]
MADPVFGIERLDEDLRGLPDKKIVVFSASPAVGNEVFGYQIIHNNLLNKKKVLLLLNRTSPSSYLIEMKEYDFTVSDDLKILDAYSNITGIQQSGSENVVVIQNPADKEEIFSKIGNEIEKGYDLVVVDSLSLIVDQFDFDTAAKLIDLISSKINQKKGTGVLLFTEWDYDRNGVNSIFNRANAVIDIKGVEKRVIFGQYFAVIKCDWIKEQRAMTSALFKALKPGGIKLYIPKILVTGPTDAGKSSFIHSACPNAVS